jgi:hypothetical protein
MPALIHTISACHPRRNTYLKQGLERAGNLSCRERYTLQIQDPRDSLWIQPGRGRRPFALSFGIRGLPEQRVDG